MKPKDTQIHVKVTTEEKKLFRKYAESRHTDLSELIRQFFHAAIDSQAKERAA